MEGAERRRGLEVWAVEQIDAPPPVRAATPEIGSGSEASTASQGSYC